MGTRFLASLLFVSLTVPHPISASCSGGVCGATISIPQVNNATPFKKTHSTQKADEQGDRTYKFWLMADNAGDPSIGENRFMTGLDLTSVLKKNDKISLFGLISETNSYGDRIKSGRFSYLYPFGDDRYGLELSYAQTNYSLGEVYPGAYGIGKMRSYTGEFTYNAVSTDDTKLTFSFNVALNKIDEKVTNSFFSTKTDKETKTLTAAMHYIARSASVSQDLTIGIKTGYLSFDNDFDEKLDKETYDTQGSYTKVTLSYQNSYRMSSWFSFDTTIKGQYAFSSKNLDPSEAFVAGGINGVNLFEEGTSYDSNGALVDVEAKFHLPDFSSMHNTFGIFYQRAELWASDPLPQADKHRSLQSAGVGYYTSYKSFFANVRGSFDIGGSDIPTWKDKDHRVLFQVGFTF